jgi:hypothetical protein
MRDLMPLEAAVESPLADSQHLGGCHAVAVDLSEGVDDVVALQMSKMRHSWRRQ